MMNKYLALIPLIASLTGCSVVQKASGGLIKRTPTEIRAASTNYVERITYVTNYVTLREASTNSAGVAVPAIVQPHVTASTTLEPVILPAVTVTNLSLAPVVTGAVAMAGDLAPVPWAGAAGTILLGVVGSVFGFINDRRARKALGEASDWEKTARTLIGNVESLRKTALSIPGYTPAIDAKVIRGIEVAQAVAGVKPAVDAILQEHKVQTLPDNFYSAHTASAI